mgnify:FL=1
MKYCDIDDLCSRVDEKVLINLTNDKAPFTSVNEDIVNENIEIATDLVNSSLRNKYKLPLRAVPKIITQVTADIVIYRLYSRRPQDVPKNYQQNYEYALSILKDIQSGSKVLELPSSSETEKETTIGTSMYLINKDDSDRRFSPRQMRGFSL